MGSTGAVVIQCGRLQTIISLNSAVVSTTGVMFKIEGSEFDGTKTNEKFRIKDGGRWLYMLDPFYFCFRFLNTLLKF